MSERNPEHKPGRVIWAIGGGWTMRRNGTSDFCCSDGGITAVNNYAGASLGALSMSTGAVQNVDATDRPLVPVLLPRGTTG